MTQRTFRIVDSKYYPVPETWLLCGVPRPMPRCSMFIIQQDGRDIAACFSEVRARLVCLKDSGIRIASWPPIAQEMKNGD